MGFRGLGGGTLSRVAQARLGRERPLRGTEMEKAPGTGNDLV